MYRTTRGTEARGQTTLDFAIAMGLFLLAVAFTFMFVPSLTVPFVEASQDHSVAADRVGSHLAMGGLGDPDQPYVVDPDCATPFFDDAADDEFPSHCAFNSSTTEDRYKQRVGLGVDRDLRIDIVHVDPTASGEDRYRRVFYDNETGNVTHEDVSGVDIDEGEDVVYAIGPATTIDDSTTVARRIVTVPDCDFGADVETCDVTLRVIVW